MALGLLSGSRYQSCQPGAYMALACRSARSSVGRAWPRRRHWRRTGARWHRNRALADAGFPQRTVHRAHLRIDADRLEHRDDELEEIEEDRARLIDLEDDGDGAPLLVESEVGCRAWVISSSMAFALSTLYSVNCLASVSS